ncbi:hypothetical protein ACS0TY_024545 [Phlomoides rotata]
MSSMDRINLESRNVDWMRKMMLMQEQVFKHQVHELHRLYNLQKKLMEEIEKNELKQRRDATDDPKESSTPSSVDHFEDEESADVEVDLTLSIGHSRTKLQRSKSNLHKCSTQLQDSDQSNEGSSSGRREERVGISVCQDNTRPRWLLQDLHLNRR